MLCQCHNSRCYILESLVSKLVCLFSHVSRCVSPDGADFLMSDTISESAQTLLIPVHWQRLSAGGIAFGVTNLIYVMELQMTVWNLLVSGWENSLLWFGALRCWSIFFFPAIVLIALVSFTVLWRLWWWLWRRCWCSGVRTLSEDPGGLFFDESETMRRWLSKSLLSMFAYLCYCLRKRLRVNLRLNFGAVWWFFFFVGFLKR